MRAREEKAREEQDARLKKELDRVGGRAENAEAWVLGLSTKTMSVLCSKLRLSDSKDEYEPLVRDICSLSECALREGRRCSKKMIEELRAALARFGLEIGSTAGHQVDAVLKLFSLSGHVSWSGVIEIHDFSADGIARALLESLPFDELSKSFQASAKSPRRKPNDDW